MLCNNLVTLRGVEIKQSVDQGSIAQRIYSLSAGRRGFKIHFFSNSILFHYQFANLPADKTQDYKSCLSRVDQGLDWMMN